MEFLQNIVDNTEFPLLAAFILGIMTAISPCPLAMNFTATAYLSKNITNKRRVLLNGVFYTLGRMLCYTTLATIIYLGASKLIVARWMEQIDGIWVGIALVIIGILMLDIIKINIPIFNRLTSNINDKQSKQSYWYALFIGILFALSFCPYSGIIYFGVLIPLTLTSAEGLLLPPIFSIATGLPVIIIAFLLAYSMDNIDRFYSNIRLLEKWIRRIVASIFISVGIYFIIINL